MAEEQMTLTVCVTARNEETGAGLKDIHEEYKVKFSQVLAFQKELLDMMGKRLVATKRRHGIK